jgi:acyl dehydratase
MNVGDVLDEQRFQVTRADLVRYAGASGDFNPIHWSDRVATGVGLPGVIAHGMFTMALVGRALDTWAGGPGRVRELGCKFTKPVVVPDDDTGVTLEVRGTVAAVTADDVHLTLEVTSAGQKVLGAPRAVLAA